MALRLIVPTGYWGTVRQSSYTGTLLRLESYLSTGSPLRSTMQEYATHRGRATLVNILCGRPANSEAIVSLKAYRSGKLGRPIAHQTAWSAELRSSRCLVPKGMNAV